MLAVVVGLCCVSGCPAKPSPRYAGSTFSPRGEEFAERVMGFTTTPHYLEVTFDRHAALFHVPVDDPGFVEMTRRLAIAFKSNAPVRVVSAGGTLVEVGAE